MSKNLAVLWLLAMSPGLGWAGEEKLLPVDVARDQVVAESVKTGTWNKERAAQYLDERAQTWFEFSSAQRGIGKDKIVCISCHSVVPYALARTVLRRFSGKEPPTALEIKLISQTKNRVEHWAELDTKSFSLFYDFDDQKKKESWGTEAVLNSLVLACDDHHSGRKTVRPITAKALANLWQVQTIQGKDAGSWDWLNFGMDPWESTESRYFGAALAAIAVGTAPGYYSPAAKNGFARNVALLRSYLRVHQPAQNLHNRLWLLWAASKLEGLATIEDRKKLMEAVLAKQRSDGGWSLSSLGLVLRAGVPDAGSDGYATGLSLHVLQTAGLDKNDARLTKGLTWLATHQEPTGAWRALSVNKVRKLDTHVGQFMSTAATAFALLALTHAREGDQ